MPILKKKQKPLSPARTLSLGFSFIILTGALLLCLPISSKNGSFTGFVDCFFTAASASCVTGISVVDTFAHWSVFGQTVIMLLIQVGGLGFLTLVTFFNIALGKKLGFMHASSISSDLTMTGLSSTKKIFVRVVMFSFAIEIIGALLLMIRLVPLYGGYGIYMSFFTAVSAFCNAGFDLFILDGKNVGMTIFADDPYVLIVTSVLVLIGSLGFIVWEELVSYRKTKNLSLHTRVVLIATAVLTVTATLVYMIIGLSEPEAFSGYNASQWITNSFFSSVCARSAGFAASPLPTVNSFSKLFTILLMFIGAAPGSTGGGIKVTTVAILISTAVSVIKGKDDTEMMKHTVSKSVVYKTLSTFCLYLIFMLTGFFLIHIINVQYDSLDTLFEVVAAFSTTGYTTGLTAQSGTATKLILCFIMFIGRIGPVSLMLSFTGKNTKNRNQILPQGEIMVG